MVATYFSDPPHFKVGVNIKIFVLFTTSFITNTHKGFDAMAIRFGAASLLFSLRLK